LISVSGIGPRLAVTILSGGSWKDWSARSQRRSGKTDRDSRSRKKTAERIVMELRDKLKEFTCGGSEIDRRVGRNFALENLGYPPPVVDAALRRAMDGETNPEFDPLFRRTLQILTKG
jgi:Holliday junction resolvasome RuvABC DNA-binding subunit